MHVGTWVSECTLFKRIGRYIGAFQEHEGLTTKLFRARALMKMYSEGTALATGPDPRRYAEAEEKMLRASMRLDKIAAAVLQAKNLAFTQNRDNSKTEGAKEDLEEDEQRDYNNQLDADVVAAFVTFEYTESFARCIEDYTKYSTFPHNLFYPEVLLHIAAV